MTPMLKTGAHRNNRSVSAASSPFTRATKSFVKIDESDSRQESAVDMIAATTAIIIISTG